MILGTLQPDSTPGGNGVTRTDLQGSDPCDTEDPQTRERARLIAA